MAQSNARGLAELIKLFDQLPADAEAALREELPKAAELILALQQGDVPVRSGDLLRGLSVQQLDGGLKVRAGLIGTTNARTGKTSLNDLFYGRIVEGGRKEQVVRVERRRRVGGRLRSSRGRKIAADIVATYNLTVSARDAHPFVDTPKTEAAALATMEAVADIIAAKMEGQ